MYYTYKAIKSTETQLFTRTATKTLFEIVDFVTEEVLGYVLKMDTGREMMQFETLEDFNNSVFAF
jgi:hypothetical protein